MAQAAGMTSRGLLLAGTCMVGVFKLLGEVLAALLIERLARRDHYIYMSCSFLSPLVGREVAPSDPLSSCFRLV